MDSCVLRRSKAARDRHDHGRAGFTIVELMVSCLVLSVALLGVYAIFTQAMSMEEEASSLWDDRTAAAAVADHLTDALEHVVNLPGIPALVGRRGDEENEWTMTLTTISPAPSDGSPARVERRRYCWRHDPDAPDATVLELQTAIYAGTTNVTPIDGLAELDETEMWKRLGTEVIGTRLRSIWVSYRTANDPDAEWKDRWNGKTGNVMVRVSVSVGKSRCERTVVPRVNETCMSE